MHPLLPVSNAVAIPRPCHHHSVHTRHPVRHTVPVRMATVVASTQTPRPLYRRSHHTARTCHRFVPTYSFLRSASPAQPIQRWLACTYVGRQGRVGAVHAKSAPVQTKFFLPTCVSPRAYTSPSGAARQKSLMYIYTCPSWWKPYAGGIEGLL